MSSVLVINLTPPDEIECAMCEARGDWRHAVPYYERPVREGESQGGYRCVCPPCYAHWDAWSDRRVSDVRRLVAERDEFRLLEAG